MEIKKETPIYEFPDNHGIMVAKHTGETIITINLNSRDYTKEAREKTIFVIDSVIAAFEELKQDIANKE